MRKSITCGRIMILQYVSKTEHFMCMYVCMYYVFLGIRILDLLVMTLASVQIVLHFKVGSPVDKLTCHYIIV